MTTATPLETVTLEDPSARARVLLAPTRGGMATRMFVGDRAVFYLDEATLLDEKQNVRGGNPVLFPSPGPLAEGRFERGGRSGSMKQHGFARNRAWTVRETSARSVTLALASDEATRAVFPWDFDLAYRYALAGARLRVEQRVTNRSDAPMPFAAGFHPYFSVPNAEKVHASVPTAATRAFDNVTKKEIALAGPIDLTAAEVDLHLVDHGASEASLVVGDRRVVVSASPEYARWVIWTIAGKDFVCVEPWTAPANALNTGANLITLAPGETKELWVEMAAC